MDAGAAATAFSALGSSIFRTESRNAPVASTTAAAFTSNFSPVILSRHTAPVALPAESLTRPTIST